jgi:uncharacterized protein (TIGR02001 family)
MQSHLGSARVLLTSAILGVMLPVTGAFAETSATVSASNMYLYRGINLSEASPQIAGSLDYAHNSGLYTGIWGSSEGVSGSPEYDVYVGYSVELGGISLDANITDYNYPETEGEEKLGDYSELILSAGYTQDKMGAELKIVDGLEGATTGLGGYYYTALTGSYDKVSVTWGNYSVDELNTALPEYQHIDVGFAFNDEVSFTLSKIVDTAQGAIEDNDALFAVTWTKTFEM